MATTFVALGFSRRRDTLPLEFVLAGTAWTIHLVGGAVPWQAGRRLRLWREVVVGGAGRVPLCWTRQVLARRRRNPSPPPFPPAPFGTIPDWVPSPSADGAAEDALCGLAVTGAA